MGANAEKVLDEILRGIDVDMGTKGNNRLLISKLTNFVRKRLNDTNLSVMLPWEEDHPLKVSKQWHEADVIECGKDPVKIGTIRFRLYKEMEVANLELVGDED